jgi:hypothetical protein
MREAEADDPLESCGTRPMSEPTAQRARPPPAPCRTLTRDDAPDLIIGPLPWAVRTELGGNSMNGVDRSDRIPDPS